MIFAFAGALLPAAPPARAALPGGYSAEPIGSVIGADRMGENMIDAGDFTGDGKDDLIVGMPNVPDPNLAHVSGKVLFVNGATGEIVKTVSPPPEPSHIGADTDFGARVAKLGDIGSCSALFCSTVGPPDGLPDYAVSAPGADISGQVPDMGIVYVLDGKFPFQVMKRIELASDDRPVEGSPGFGLGLTSPAGERPCLGFGGVGDCAQRFFTQIGDVNGDSKPDVIVGAPDYSETAETNFAGCGLPDPQVCSGMGRIYIYSGAGITGSLTTPLDSPLITIKYFDKDTAGEQPRFGAAIAPIGDVGGCDVPSGFPALSARCLPGGSPAPSTTQDGFPDFLAAAPGLTEGGQPNAGAAMVVDGSRGLVIGSSASPDPQTDSGFASFGSAPPAPGDLAGSFLPDLLLGAPGLDSSFTDQGRAYVINGDVTAATTLASFEDPLLGTGGKFGSSAVGVGDVAGDSPGEVAVGRAGGPLQIFSACKPALLQTIPVPAAAADPGSDFGAAIVPIGDVNGDGYLDLAVGAPGQASGAGQVYLMKSDGTSGPSFDGCTPPATGGGGGGTGGGGGGTTGSTPPTGSTPRKKKKAAVTALARRTLTMSATRKKIVAGKLLTMKGRLSTRKRSCRVKQKVAIQRLNEVKAWLTINVGITKRDGSFATSTRPPPFKTFYRAQVMQTKRCGGAVSRRLSITASQPPAG